MYALQKIICAWILFTTMLKAFGAETHPCNRECISGESMLCEYKFVVENYIVLSRACYNCPFVRSDCWRPHCVQTNGRQRHIVTVNRQVPGPEIQVCQGDTIRVEVHNNLDDGQSTSIHWHGLRQLHSNHMDGVPGITQCNISPRESFTYEFKADNAGTHWWHSHTGVQLGDGVFGAFIVRQPARLEPQLNLYDEDLPEHVVMISDWSDVSAIYRYIEEMQDRWRVPVPLGVLVNGRGMKHMVPADRTLLGLADGEPTPDPAYTPFEVFNVTKGNRYRFRVIGAATRCYFRVMVDGHQMTVIASDGMPMVPATVGSFIVHPGERYDFVLDAQAAPGDYWLKVEAFQDCSAESHGAAIIHYNGFSGADDMMPPDDRNNFSRSDTILNALQNYQLAGTNDVITQADIRFAEDEDFTDEKVDVLYYIALRYQANDNSLYSHPEYYPQSSRYGLITPTLNNLTFYHHATPLATQWNDVTDKRFCNTSTVNTTYECHDDLCYCVHMLDIQYGQVVELFMFTQANDPHPMHLHGYHVRVVGSGWLEGVLDDPSTFTDQTITYEQVVKGDREGKYPRNLKNPMYKDTVTVDGRGAYSVLRFKADNPGLWFFHCHNEGHLMQGMALVIKVGEPKMFPIPPTSFPLCGVTRKHLLDGGKCGQWNISAAMSIFNETTLYIVLNIIAFTFLTFP